MISTRSQSGFTLIETLVSITILLIVIAGPLAISSNAAKSSSFSSEQVTAFFLAQEGAELVQKARDDLTLPAMAVPAFNPDPWADLVRTSSGGLYRTCYNGSGCDLTVNSNTTGTLTVTNCSNIDDCRLYRDSTTNNLRSRYTHTVASNTLTPFTRVITLQLVNANEIKVISKVSWRTGSIKEAQEVVVETHLFNVYGLQ